MTTDPNTGNNLGGPSMMRHRLQASLQDVLSDTAELHHQNPPGPAGPPPLPPWLRQQQQTPLPNMSSPYLLDPSLAAAQASAARTQPQQQPAGTNPNLLEIQSARVSFLQQQLVDAEAKQRQLIAAEQDKKRLAYMALLQGGAPPPSAAPPTVTAAGPPKLLAKDCTNPPALPQQSMALDLLLRGVPVAAQRPPQVLPVVPQAPPQAPPTLASLNQCAAPTLAPPTAGFAKSSPNALEALGSSLRNKNDPYIDVSSLQDPDPKDSTIKRTRGGVSTPFPEKLHEMLLDVEKEGLTHIVSFYAHGRAFGVHDPDKFVSEIMPKYFKQSKWNSFARQLNLYGFIRIQSGPDAGGYYHELFLKGRPNLCFHMRRVGVPQGGDRRKLKTKQEAPDPDFYSMKPVTSPSA